MKRWKEDQLGRKKERGKIDRDVSQQLINVSRTQKKGPNNMRRLMRKGLGCDRNDYAETCLSFPRPK